MTTSLFSSIFPLPNYISPSLPSFFFPLLPFIISYPSPSLSTPSPFSLAGLTRGDKRAVGGESSGRVEGKFEREDQSFLFCPPEPRGKKPQRQSCSEARRGLRGRREGDVGGEGARRGESVVKRRTEDQKSVGKMFSLMLR